MKKKELGKLSTKSTTKISSLRVIAGTIVRMSLQNYKVEL